VSGRLRLTQEKHGCSPGAAAGVDSLLMLLLVLLIAFGYRDTFKGSQQGSLLAMSVDSVRIVARSPRLLALFPALFLVFAGWLLATTYLPLAVERLYSGSSLGTAVGVVLGIGGLVTPFVGPLMGSIADRYGHWRTLLVGLALEVVLLPLPALTHHRYSFSVAWALLNGVASGCFALSFTVLAHSAPSAVCGRVMSFAYLPVNASGLLGPAVRAVVARASIFAVFPAAGAVTLLDVGALALARRPAPVRANEASTPEPEATPVGQPH
jgi:MFS family permease